jgi:curved DNA-binding protein CbpA
MAGWDPMTPWHDYYDDLNLHFGATPSQIKSAYNALALNTHPDKTGIPDATDFIRVQKAYKKLSDEEFRMAYNKTYWNNKLQHDPAGFENFTRTKEYEEEEARRKNRSPPPIKPVQKYGEPGYKYLFGRPYVAWKKRMAAWRARHPEEEEK